MNSALWFLAWRSFVNLSAQRLRQLRQPRYAVAILIGVAYLWAFLARRGTAGTQPSPMAAHRELLSAVGVALAVAWTWLAGTAVGVLTFSPAEVAFLFSGPVTRRTLVQFKLVRAQGRIIWSTLLWAVILSPARFGSEAWMRIGAIWLLLTTLYLHRVGAALVRTSLVEHGGAGIRRHVPAVIAGLAVATLLAVTASHDLANIRASAAAGGGAVLEAVEAASRRPAAAAILFPFRLLVRPVTAHEPSDWMRAVWPALLLLAVNFVWVLRSDTAFEEASIAASVRRAAVLDAMRRGAPQPTSSGAPLARTLIPLAPLGAPSFAILWKNLVNAGRARRVRSVAAGFAIAVALASYGAFHHLAWAPVAGTLIGTWAALSLLMGPQWVRNDLRNDLAHLELLRSYPLRGAEIVAAEAAGSATVLTVIQLMMAIVAYCAFLGSGDTAFPFASRGWLVVGLAFVLPVVNYLGFLIMNGAALAFPAWVRVGSARTAGIEAIGQSVLTMGAYLIALLLILLLPTAAAAAIVWLLHALMGSIAAVPALVAALALAGAEAFVLLRVLGRWFEQLEPGGSGIQPG